MAMDAKKLKEMKMKMPKKPMAEEEAEMDLEQELGAAEEAAPEAEQASEEAMAMDSESPAADLSDEDLMREILSRGLMEELNKMSSSASEEAPTAE